MVSLSYLLAIGFENGSIILHHVFLHHHDLWQIVPYLEVPYCWSHTQSVRRLLWRITYPEDNDKQLSLRETYHLLSCGLDHSVRLYTVPARLPSLASYGADSLAETANLCTFLR
jgi:hypothetical protein